MKKTRVVIQNNTKMQIVECSNIYNAMEYIKKRYVAELRNAAFYDYEHSFIAKNYSYAQVSAGTRNIKMWVSSSNKYNYCK